MTKCYFWPEGEEGIGSDIKWCERHQGGKFCLLCGNHAKFEEWSKEWKWYYLITWHDDCYGWFKKGVLKKRWPYTHSRANWQYYRNWNRTGRRSWGSYYKWPNQPNPKRYSSRGLDAKQFNSLLKKGCRKNKKCKCASLIQRGNWYCPECYELIYFFADYKGEHPHDIMIMDRRELKRELLVLKISGVL